MRKNKTTTKTAPASKAPADFTKALFAQMTAHDRNHLPSAQATRYAESMLDFSQNRKAGSLKLRLGNHAGAHTILESINDDMPFLLDSILAELHQHGLSVDFASHPTFYVRRDKMGNLLSLSGQEKPEDAKTESFITIQIDRCLNEAMIQKIETNLHAILKDVRHATQDWGKMRMMVEDVVTEASTAQRRALFTEEVDEACEFLRWLDNNNFTFLGYHRIDLGYTKNKFAGFHVMHETGLGILRNPKARVFGGLRDKSVQTDQIQRHLAHDRLVVITKTSLRTGIHRPGPMDAIFIRRFDEAGRIIAEHLFVGLFTSASYMENPRDVPFLRNKIARTLEKSCLAPTSHDGKALTHIVNTYPRDELFQIDEDTLFDHLMGILHLQERAHTALFTRPDPFGRFVTCFVLVPREQYNAFLRTQIEKLLVTAWQGNIETMNLRLDDSMFASLFLLIKLDDKVPAVNTQKLEAELQAICRAWNDKLRDQLTMHYSEAQGLELLRDYSTAFPAAYRNAVTPETAIIDIINIERLQNHHSPLLVDLLPTDSHGLYRIKFYHAHTPLMLTDILPLIEKMGMKTEQMTASFEVKPHRHRSPVFLHEFVGRPSCKLLADFAKIKPMFEDMLVKIHAGEAENDRFNALTLSCALSWVEVRAVRALARYLHQLRVPFSQETMAGTLLAHAPITQKLLQLFLTRHNPAIKGNRADLCAKLESEILHDMNAITSEKDDRLLRCFLALITHSLRTNYFQRDAKGAVKSYLSIKFNSRGIDFMPLPKPLIEVFVYSLRVEAIHLRGGKVARGGIRWSDRLDDFRSEILGLMKAQMVKNTVIVPVGSKGGFVVKYPQQDAEKNLAEGIECYRTLMRGLLDITDNRASGKIIPPMNVVRHDGDDPYLVVAADKGTAKFSDIANGISQEYGFWLDDAFASGGSAGYDHKGMGITARGAWTSIQRHFREIGTDIQTTDFTCVGVGDMSGDVFGNAMLLSRHIRLLAAFDHRHIFCDPNPDSASSYHERERMFNLPRSSWDNYDRKKISKGGGVFARSEKTIKISAEMKNAFGITADSLAPADLIRAMLKSKIDLLYFGGIGTFVKSSDESHEEVGDRTTEALRINGAEINARVVGEGANLGFTQNGRIEYALNGGRINTDAIDNSAGVDTSDHEVNIKILLRQLVLGGKLSLPARNKLLSSLTKDVGILVLRDNYLQTAALSVAEAMGNKLLLAHGRSMRMLEKSGLLNRAVEFLPDDAMLIEREKSGKPLTRAELAVLLAYSKMALYNQIVSGDLVRDNFLKTSLAHYFPQGLQDKYAKEIQNHQLRDEIVATILANTIINRTGSHFILMHQDQSGASAEKIARAFLIVQESFGLQKLWDGIEALDNKASAQSQITMLQIICDTLQKNVAWFLQDGRMPEKLVMNAYQAPIQKLMVWMQSHPSPQGEIISQNLISQNVPPALAKTIAILPQLGSAFDLITMAQESGDSVEQVTDIFFAVGARFGFNWLNEKMAGFATNSPRGRDAAGAILGDLTADQCSITARILKTQKGKKLDKNALIAGWCAGRAARVERLDAAIHEWRGADIVDLAILTLANRQIAGLLN